MPVSPWLLGVPDTSGDIFLANVNGNFYALATNSFGTTEPPTKAAGLQWFDSNDARMKLRNQSNGLWVPIYAVRNNQSIPIYKGIEVSDIVALQPSNDGYVRCKNGTFLLENIDSPDIPMFGVNRSGIVPGVTTTQSNQPYKLLSNGGWGEPGPVKASEPISFAGAKEYSVGVLPSRQYSIKIKCLMNGGQALMMQVGSSGSPSQSGYGGKLSGNGNYHSSDRGFIIYGTHTSARGVMADCTLTNITGNTWAMTCYGGNLGTSDQEPEVYRGEVTLSGRLNYIRVLSAGSPLGSFNNTNSLDSGYMSVLA